MKITLNEYLDRLLTQHRFRNDAALCRAIRVSAPAISKIRCGRVPLTAFFFARLNEYLGVQLVELRATVHAYEFSLEMQPVEG